jgi:hypothetical protein
MNLLRNIWQHPRTSVAGFLIAVITIAGILSQQGVTLGNAGNGTMVSLIGAVAAGLLGLLAKDPGTGNTTTGGLSKAFAVLVIGGMVAMLTGCPANISQQQQAAQASENAAIVVQGLQSSEIALYSQGLVSTDDHRFIQTNIATVAALGKTTDACIKAAGNKTAIGGCLNTAVLEIDQINTNGGLYIKSDQAKKDFQLAMTGVKSVLLTVETMLGAAPTQ